MSDEKMVPKITNEYQLAKPFGKRMMDKFAKRRKATVKLSSTLPIAMLSIAVFTLWIKVPKNILSTFRIKDVHFDTKTGTGKFFLVPPLIVNVEVNRGNQYKNLKTSKINVVSFMSGGLIPPGVEAKAVLLSGATNGMIKAQLTESLKVDGSSILEPGVLLIGEGQSSEDRLFIRFSKAVFKNGKFIRIAAQAYELSDKILGLKGSRAGDYTIKLAASSGLHFLSGMSSGLKSEDQGFSYQPRQPPVSDAALQGLAQAASEQAKLYLDQIKNKGPVLEVKSGTVFIVTFEGSEP